MTRGPGDAPDDGAAAVLVVEDEPAVSRAVGRALRGAGHQPLLRETAAQAQAATDAGCRSSS